MVIKNSADEHMEKPWDEIVMKLSLEAGLSREPECQKSKKWLSMNPVFRNQRLFSRILQCYSINHCREELCFHAKPNDEISRRFSF